MKLGLVILEHGMKRISARLGPTIRPVILTDGRQAIDVDNERTHAVVEQRLSVSPDARSHGDGASTSILL